MQPRTRWLLLLVGLWLTACGDAVPVPSLWEVTGEFTTVDLSAEDEFSSPDIAHQDGSGEVLVPCEPGEVCDDNDPCTTGDFCKGGFCTGMPLDCDDGLDCTHDLCTEDGECDYPLRAGFCLIEDACHEDGDLSAASPCLECITAVTVDDWVGISGPACDDMDSCTDNDHCQAGLCVGDTVTCPDPGPCLAAICIDGECVNEPADEDCGSNACVTAACVDGECVVAPGLPCDDDNPCTDDSCDPATGCHFEPNSMACDDGNACTVDDLCSAGVCAAGALLVCDDQNPCTDDSCHPVSGCAHFPNNGACDDGDPCLEGDYCVAGSCLPGVLPVICDDDNPCTDSVCEPFVGCVDTPNTDPCDDGDPCFANDICTDGQCEPGPDPLACDDGNSCTQDGCEPGAGCFHVVEEGPCDDGSLCTDGDSCQGGECIGATISCDDGNECTTDSCQPDAGCQYKAITSKACRPQIVITYPPRGATINGGQTVTVTGSVTSKAGSIDEFSINGDGVALGVDGSFAYPMTAQQGMNLIIAEAVDSAGGSSRTTPSFYFSTTWYMPDINDVAMGMVPDGIMAFLGPEVWDDNDTSDVDDLATIMTLYLQGLDLSTLITNPVTSGTQGWCNYVVNVSNITYGAAQVDLVPIAGGLAMTITIPDFAADIVIDMSGFLCPDLAGKATASSITITANVLIAMVDGELTAEMVGTNVSVNDLNISLDGLWGFLLNWLINFFEGQFAEQLEATFEEQLGAIIPATIVDALSSLALDQTIPVAPMMGDGDPVNLQLKTALYSVDFQPEGASLGLAATVVVDKAVGHNPLGSIGRASCLADAPELFGFPMKGQLEIALHDDFFNQLPFAMYWAGMFNMDVDPAELGANLSAFGLTDVQLAVDFLLPTILTTCTPDGEQVLQIGDIQVDGTMKMNNLPVTMTVFASLEVAASIVAVASEGGKELSVALGDVRIMEVEVAEVTGPLAGAEEILVGLIEENLVGGLLDSFSQGALGSFPIPDIDLSGFDPSIPPGSGISLDLQEILRVFGYTVLSGNVQ